MRSVPLTPVRGGLLVHSGTGATAVRLVQLTKCYPGRRTAAGEPIASVDRVDLRIDWGEVYGLLGANGAGKSTIVRMIATLLEPTSGRVEVCGMDAGREQRRVRDLLGVAIGGERSVYWKLTARQNLEYYAALYGISRKRARPRIQQVLLQMDLVDRADDYVERYSTGMRQRLVIGRALLHDPKLLLLDEPASGLDPRAAEDLHVLIRRLRAEGRTILLTTHDMAEADELCDRIGIIDRGVLVAEGTPAALKRTIGASQVLNSEIRPPSPQALGAALTELEREVTIKVTRLGDTATVTLLGAPGDDLVGLLYGACARHGIALARLEHEQVSLKDVFLALVGRTPDSDGSGSYEANDVPPPYQANGRPRSRRRDGSPHRPDEPPRQLDGPPRQLDGPPRQLDGPPRQSGDGEGSYQETGSLP